MNGVLRGDEIVKYFFTLIDSRRLAIGFSMDSFWGGRVSTACLASEKQRKGNRGNDFHREIVFLFSVYAPPEQRMGKIPDFSMISTVAVITLSIGSYNRLNSVGFSLRISGHTPHSRCEK